MKKLTMIVVVVLGVLIAVAFAKDFIIKTSVEAGVGVVTGLRISIGSFRAGILSTLVDIGNLKIYNPEGFKDKVMLDMPKIYVDYDLSDIMKGTIHMTAIKIYLREFVVVKNESGQLNLDSLKVVQAEKDGGKAEAKEAGKLPPIRIDVLELKIGRVLYKDYSRGGEPMTKEFNINLDERYENITDPYSIVSLIVVKAMANTSVGSMAGFDVRGLQKTIPGILGSAQKVATRAASEVHKTAAKALKGIGDMPGNTHETVKKTTDALKGALSMPFADEKE